jgi:peptide deformylase
MKILLYPDSRLTADNKPLDIYTDIEAQKVNEMFKLMYKTNGIGLAAPQVGWNVKLFILNLTGNQENKNDEKIYFNPSIILSGDLITDIEGCLSFPRIAAWIKRYQTAEITANTPTGKVTDTFVDFGARAIQHEIDHLNSQLFIERMTQADLRRYGKIIRQMKNNTKN